jgi:hypothetical protein
MRSRYLLAELEVVDHREAPPISHTNKKVPGFKTEKPLWWACLNASGFDKDSDTAAGFSGISVTGCLLGDKESLQR